MFIQRISYLTIPYLLVIVLGRSVSNHISQQNCSQKYPKPTPFLFKNNVLTSESLEVPPTSDKGPVSGPSSFPFPFSGFFWSFPVSGISAFPFSGISAFPFSGISSTPVSFSGSIVSGFTSGLSSVYFFFRQNNLGEKDKRHTGEVIFFREKKQQATGKQTYPNHQY